MLNEHLHAAVRKNAAVFELGRAFDDIIISADISNSSCRQTNTHKRTLLKTMMNMMKFGPVQW